MRYTSSAPRLTFKCFFSLTPPRTASACQVLFDNRSEADWGHGGGVREDGGVPIEKSRDLAFRSPLVSLQKIGGGECLEEEGVKDEEINRLSIRRK